MKKILIMSVVAVSMISISSQSEAFMGFGRDDDSEMSEKGKGRGKGPRGGNSGRAFEECGIEISDTEKECMKECKEKHMEERKSNKSKCKDAEDREACRKEMKENREEKTPCHEECNISLTSEQKECMDEKRKQGGPKRGRKGSKPSMEE